MNARWLVLLLAVTAVCAQDILDGGAALGGPANGEVTDDIKPSGFGAAPAHTMEVIGAPSAPGDVVALGGSVTDLVGGRRLLGRRALKGIDGDGTNVTINPATNVYSKLFRHCPTDPTLGTWQNFDAYPNGTAWAMYGDLVHDNFICDIAGTGKAKVVTSANATGVTYGGAAQDFGAARPLWESYGWSLFKLANPPVESNLDHVKIQGLTLHVIGNVGTKHGVGVNCGIKGVSVAIYNANPSAPYDPTARNYSKYIDLSGAGVETFTWNSNKTAALYVDIGVFPDAYPRFDNNTFHWLRVKLHADYTGLAGATTGQCFAFWGVSSNLHPLNTGNYKSRWQERIGGSSGYSTTCIGAANSGNATNVITSGTGMNAPGEYQTWWNCWNNGLNTQAGNTGRRCSTYRATVTPAIPSADCLDATNRARFNDYNYAFTGIQGQSGVGEEPGQGGLGGV